MNNEDATKYIDDVKRYLTDEINFSQNVLNDARRYINSDETVSCWKPKQRISVMYTVNANEIGSKMVISATPSGYQVQESVMTYKLETDSELLKEDSTSHKLQLNNKTLNASSKGMRLYGKLQEMKSNSSIALMKDFIFLKVLTSWNLNPLRLIEQLQTFIEQPEKLLRCHTST
ncbi:CLUMA_CG004953, isoform A [Clunio marinus]|uniref:CLUMA_CG004953, isoform A n=1 Tax=Clunio marinus TaxID=568069 RepID=A0A1J1HUQ5_9DIPT|nr:CLUMA_CG004953, isoform A [Clunio marinus]